MALAWNAGWVNRPQGFKSPILRTWSGVSLTRHPGPAKKPRRGMRRGIAVVWHASSFILAACLYFFFVLPRWPELTGDVPHTWGTVLRIVTGAVLGLTALPVLFTLLKKRRPEFGTPQLALSLRLWSIIGHVLAGAMIIVTAVVEIWVSLDRAGPWLFAVYGAAAAIAVLSALAFYLA